MPKQSAAFDGLTIHYRMWAKNMRLHMMSKQMAWLRLLELVEAEKQPMTNLRISTIETIDGKEVDLAWLSHHVWAFILQNVNDAVHAQSTALAGGEEFNGLELWRRMFVNHEGGAEQVTLKGIRNFMGFPKCHKT